MPTSLDAGGLAGPRERLLLLGEQRLADVDCVALLRRSGRRGAPAEATAQRLLQQMGGLAGLAGASPLEVAAQRGLDRPRAAALGAAFGLARRLQEARLLAGTPIRSCTEVAGLVQETARGSRKEAFFAVQLDARRRVLSVRMISQGGVDSAPVQPREVFAPAIREGAAAVVVAHNHPSGDPTPSPEDRAVTERLRQAAALLSISLLDHVIVGDQRCFSFAEERFLPLA